MPKNLKTSDIAKIIGVHVNTVRLYEAQGYLSVVSRSSTGYRQYTRLHLEQMKLAHLALQWPYSEDKSLVQELVKSAADGDLGMAMELAYRHLINVRIELTHAEAAVELLERWAQGQMLDTTKHRLTIGQTAQHLRVTTDQLRNWDRNGLLDVPRDPDTGYRMYGAQEIGRLRVIRMLRQSGYSTMAILRVLRKFDAGERESLRETLDTPDTDEDIETLADRWLSTLQQQEDRARTIIQQITVITKLSTH
ncbi:MAG: MerR family transcriptional regulator [Anaerolineae bacterium]|nr:MerR family transcriptional regulator [Anaerolineae bacterium]